MRRSRPAEPGEGSLPWQAVALGAHPQPGGPACTTPPGKPAGNSPFPPARPPDGPVCTPMREEADAAAAGGPVVAQLGAVAAQAGRAATPAAELRPCTARAAGPTRRNAPPRRPSRRAARRVAPCSTGRRAISPSWVQPVLEDVVRIGALLAADAVAGLQGGRGSVACAPSADAGVAGAQAGLPGLPAYSSLGQAVALACVQEHAAQGLQQRRPARGDAGPACTPPAPTFFMSGQAMPV